MLGLVRPMCTCVYIFRLYYIYMSTWAFYQLLRPSRCFLQRDPFMVSVVPLSGAGGKCGSHCHSTTPSNTMRTPYSLRAMAALRSWSDSHRTVGGSAIVPRYHYPYTYSHLRGFLDCLADHPYSGTLFSRRVCLGQLV